MRLLCTLFALVVLDVPVRAAAPPTPAFPLALRFALDGKTAEARAAILKMEALGTAARPALGKLRRWARDEQHPLCPVSRRVLVRIAAGDPEYALEYFLHLLAEEAWRSNPPPPSDPTVQKLFRCQRRLPQFLPLVYEKHRQHEGRLGPMYAMYAMGPAAAPVLPKLLGELKRRPRHILPIIQVIGRMGPAAEPAIPALVNQLRNPHLILPRNPISAAARDALVSIGRAAQQHLLREIEKDPPRPITWSGIADPVVDALHQFRIPLDDLLWACLTTKPNARHVFADLIGRRGKAAVPALIAILRKPWAGGPTTVVALRALSSLGPDAHAAVPTIAFYLRRADHASDALSALTAIGPAAKDATSAIAARLETETSSYLAEIQALEAIGEGARESAPALVRLANHKAANGLFPHRRSAAFALAKIDPESARPFLPELLAAMTEINLWRNHRTLGQRMRQAEAAAQAKALRAIARIGRIDEKSILAVANWLRKCEYASVASACNDVIRKQGKLAAVAAPTLLESIRKDPVWTRHHAAAPLGYIVTQEPKVLPEVVSLLRSRDAYHGLRVVYFAGPGGKPLKEEVFCLLESREEAVRAWAHHALKEMKLGPQLLPLWGRALRDRVVHIRTTALEAIIPCGELAAPLTERIQRLTASSDSNESQLAVNALRAASAAKLAREAFAALRDPKNPRRVEAARIVLALGADARSESKLLLHLLDDSNRKVRTLIMQTLAQLEPPLTAALPALMKRARPAGGLDGKERIAALDAIGALGPAGRKAVPLLVSVVKEDARRMLDGQKIRQAATKALGNIGAAARPALPVLREYFAEEQRQRAGGLLFSNTFIGDVLPKAIEKIEAARE